MLKVQLTCYYSYVFLAPRIFRLTFRVLSSHQKTKLQRTTVNSTLDSSSCEHFFTQSFINSSFPPLLAFFLVLLLLSALLLFDHIWTDSKVRGTLQRYKGSSTYVWGTLQPVQGSCAASAFWFFCIGIRVVPRFVIFQMVPWYSPSEALFTVKFTDACKENKRKKKKTHTHWPQRAIT